MTIIDVDKKQQVILSEVKRTQEWLVTEYNKLDKDGNRKKFINFVGGIELSTSEAEELELTSQFPFTASLNKTKVLIRICTPHPPIDGKCINWMNTTAETFEYLAQLVGIERMFLESHWLKLLNGVEYALPIEEIM